MSGVLPPTDWKRVMVLAPHPDDETLATGGLLQQAVSAGAAVRVLFVTDGDNNPWPQRAVERQWQIGSTARARWGKRRRGEALAALACLGVAADSASFLGYPDQGLTSLLLAGEEELLVTLADEIAAWRPTLLVTPSTQDLHPDHSALAVFVRFACARLGAHRSSLTEMSYVVHRHGSVPATAGWVELRLSLAEQARQRQAILCHATQLLLSKRRFLDFATETERFLLRTEPRAHDAHHPVRHLTVAGTNLQLELATQTRLGAFGPTTLYIVGKSAAGCSARRAVTLPGKSAAVTVRDTVSGAVRTQGCFRGTRRQGTLTLPLSALSAVEQMFVKLERRFGFFDEAGWREIPLPHVPLSLLPHQSAGQAAPVVCCVIPCYNVASLCGAVVREVVEYANHVIAIDDGSTDGTGAVLRRIAAESGGRVRVLSSAKNRGKGVALLAGFRQALADHPFDVLVTLDGDRQHRPADIPRLVRPCIEEHAALVVGEQGQFGEMPLRSRLGNTLTAGFLRYLYPASPHDTQSGMRALERSFAAEVVRLIKGRRYETELHILLLALEQRRRICTVPLPTVYLDGNRSSHFRPVTDSLRIYWALLGWLLSPPQRGLSSCSLREREAVTRDCGEREQTSLRVGIKGPTPPMP